MTITLGRTFVHTGGDRRSCQLPALGPGSGIATILRRWLLRAPEFGLLGCEVSRDEERHGEFWRETDRVSENPMYLCLLVEDVSDRLVAGCARSSFRLWLIDMDMAVVPAALCLNAGLVPAPRGNW